MLQESSKSREAASLANLSTSLFLIMSLCLETYFNTNLVPFSVRVLETILALI